MVTVLLIAVVVLLFFSVPVAVCLGFASLIALHVKGLPLINLAQSVYEALDSFPLMAIPFFILAGHLMQTGGISRRLIALANALVGWFRGGLGSASVLASMFFSTISGSSSATTAAIGSTLIPAMEKKGYPKPFAAATCAAAGELGVIIPPSIPMVVYGLVANVSIGSLFMAGFLPGLLIGLSLMGTIVLVARLRGFDLTPALSVAQWRRQFWHAFRDSFWALLMPFIILGVAGAIALITYTVLVQMDERSVVRSAPCRAVRRAGRPRTHSRSILISLQPSGRATGRRAQASGQA